MYDTLNSLDFNTLITFLLISGKLQAVLLLTALMIAQSGDSLFAGTRSSFSLKDFQQARGAVEGVVKSVPAFQEADVAAELAAQ